MTSSHIRIHGQENVQANEMNFYYTSLFLFFFFSLSLSLLGLSIQSLGGILLRHASVDLINEAWQEHGYRCTIVYGRVLVSGYSSGCLIGTTTTTITTANTTTATIANINNITININTATNTFTRRCNRTRGTHPGLRNNFGRRDFSIVA